MGYLRQGQPPVFDRATIAAMIAPAVAEEINTLTATDPFGIDDPCPFNPGGHDAIASCSEIVCCHCAKVFWR